MPRSELEEKLGFDLNGDQIATVNAEDERRAIAEFNELFRRFPAGASLSDTWRISPEALGGRTVNDFARDFLVKCLEVTGASPADPLLVIWDDAAMPTIRLTAETLVRRFVDLWQPPHMYVLDVAGSWAAAWMMTGDMDLCISPTSNRQLPK